MLKKVGKKLISVLLTVVLIATTFFIFDPSILVQKSKAALDTKKLVNTVEPAINFYVPETIYLNPVINSGSQPYDFQYFVDCDENGTLHKSATQTTGTIYFSCSTACDSITISWENSTVTTTTDKSTSQVVKQTITGGTTSVYDGRVKVTCTYVIGGVTYYAYAYTYMYYPDLDLLTGVATSYVYKTSIGDEPKLAAFAFITGVHYVGNNTSLSGDERAVSNYYDQYTTTSSKGAYGLSPLIPNWSSLASFYTSDSNANITNRDVIYNETTSTSKFIESGNGGVYFHQRERGSSTKITRGGIDNCWGTLYVDTSRITNYNQIPNLRGGYICHYYENCSDGGRLDLFASTDGSISVTSNISFKNGDGKGYGMTSAESLSGDVAETDTDYTMDARFYYKRSSSSGVTVHYTFGFKVRVVDKAALRSAYRDAIGDGIQEGTADNNGWSDDVKASWTTAYAAYASALDEAGTILGKPYATAAEVSSALTKLSTTKTACDNIINGNFVGGENNDLLNRVVFYVPETIFLNQSDGTTFQYIYGVDTDGVAESGIDLTSATSARIYFKGINCDPTSVKITCIGSTSDNSTSWNSTSTSVISSITYGGTAFTGTTANSTGKTYTSFPVDTTCSAGTLSSAVTAGNYKFLRWRADYVVDGTTFTTYAYSVVYRQPTYTAYYRHSSRAYTSNTRSPAFINASLTVSGLNVGSVSGENGSTDAGSKSSNNNNATNSLDTSLVIDSTRFTRYDQLPYLNAYYSLIRDRENGTATVTAYNSSDTSTTVSIGTSATTVSLPINSSALVFYMHASAVYRSKTAQNYTYINVTPTLVDKTAIRAKYYNAVSMSRQQSWYTAGFDAYQNSILNMALKTGNPVETSTSGTLDTDNLTRYSGTLKALFYRDSSAEADYNGNKGSAIIGYEAETKTFSYGDTVYGYYNDIPGFTRSSYLLTYGANKRTSGVPQDVDRNNYYYLKNAGVSLVTWTFYYTPNTYTVTYDPNGGKYSGTEGYTTSSALFQSKFTVGQVGGTIIEEPTRIGCTFAGWKCLVDGTTYQTGDNINWEFAENVTFEAQWIYNKYTTFFNENHDGLTENLLNPGIESDTVAKTTAADDTECTLTLSPVDDGALKLNGTIGESNADVTIEELEMTAGTYTLSFENVSGSVTGGGIVVDLIGDENGTALASRIYLTSGDSDVSKTFTLTEDQASQIYGYKIWLWQDGNIATYDNLIIKPRLEKTSSSTDSNIFAHNYTYYEPYKSLPTPVREGYTFTGWYTDPTDGTKITVDSIAPYYDQTLYAHWTIKSYTVTYDYYTNGGLTVTKQDDLVVYGGDVDLTPTAEMSNWNFVGWNTDPKAKVKLESLTMPADDVTLYAIYNRDLTVNFYSGNYKTSVETKTVTVWNNAKGGTVTVPSTYEDYNGWTFLGWASDTSSSADTKYITTGNTAEVYSSLGVANYFALYSQLQTLTYNGNNADSDSDMPESVEGYGYHNAGGGTTNIANTVSSIEPTRTGYTFGGWNTSSDGTGKNYIDGTTYTNVGENDTLYANWTINKYTIVFKNGDKVLQSEIYDYGTTPVYSGAELTKAVDSENEYYFDGWSPEIVSANGNATYVAQFRAVSHEMQYSYNEKTHTYSCVNCSYVSGTSVHDFGDCDDYEETSPGYKVNCSDCEYSFESEAVKYNVRFTSEEWVLTQNCTVTQRIDPSYTTKYFIATVQTPARIGARYFVYWMDTNGEIVSSYRTYSFFATKDSTLTPVYAYQQNYETERNKAVIASRLLGCNVEDGTYTLLAEHSVAKSGASLVGHGVLYTSDINYSGDDELTIDNDNVDKKAAALSSVILTGLFEVKVDPGSASTIWARTYVIDGDGEVHYGKIKTINVTPTTASFDEDVVVLETESLDLTEINAEAEEEITVETPTETPDDTPTDAQTQNPLEKLSSIFAKLVEFINTVLSLFKSLGVIK